jgi:hypothetical protein
LFNN